MGPLRIVADVCPLAPEIGRRSVRYRTGVRDDLVTVLVDLPQDGEPSIQQLRAAVLFALDDPALDEYPMLELGLSVIGGIAQRVLAPFVPRDEANVPPRPLMSSDRACNEGNVAIVAVLSDCCHEEQQQSRRAKARAVALHQSTLKKLIRSCFS